MSEVGMRTSADTLERVLRRQIRTEDATRLRHIADQAIPRQVAPQPPQATSDRMIPRNRRLGYLQLRRWVVKAVLYVVLRARFSAWSREFA